jgi:hypothetical protein
LVKVFWFSVLQPLANPVPVSKVILRDDRALPKRPGGAPRPDSPAFDLAPRDDFEVSVEDDDIITLRRISRPANRGLIYHLLACPSSFEIPARETDDSKSLAL